MSSRVVGRVDGEVCGVSVKTVTFTWEIKNFSQEICRICVGEYFQSPKFPLGSSSSSPHCFLRLHPRGQSPCCRNYMSVNLRSTQRLEAMGGSFKIFNRRGKPVKTKPQEERLISRETGWDCWIFASRDFVLDPVYGVLGDEDKLTIGCEIKYRNSSRGTCDKRRFSRSAIPVLQGKRTSISSALKVEEKRGKIGAKRDYVNEDILSRARFGRKRDEAKEDEKGEVVGVKKDEEVEWTGLCRNCAMAKASEGNYGVEDDEKYRKDKKNVQFDGDSSAEKSTEKEKKLIVGKLSDVIELPNVYSLAFGIARKVYQYLFNEST